MDIAPENCDLADEAHSLARCCKLRGGSCGTDSRKWLRNPAFVLLRVESRKSGGSAGVPAPAECEKHRNLVVGQRSFELR
jgi:hypothetical protein